LHLLRQVDGDIAPFLDPIDDLARIGRDVIKLILSSLHDSAIPLVRNPDQLPISVA